MPNQPNAPNYPAALDQIRRHLETIAALEQRLAQCQADAERYVTGEISSLEALNTRNAYLAGGLPVIIGEAVDLAQQALAQLPAATGYESTHDSTSNVWWPEYSLEVPASVDLTCPECGAARECEVDIDSSYGPTMATARIDTDPCDGCRRWLCPACPRTTVDGDTLCAACRPQEKSDPQEAPDARL